MPTSKPQRQKRLFQSLGQPPLIFTTASHNSGDASSHVAFVANALKAGFSAIDASNNDEFPHREDWVGNGIREAIQSQGVKREQIVVQTTCRWPAFPGNSYQDLPKAEKAIEEHVHAAIKNSLRNLRHEETEKSSNIDLVLLDAPSPAYVSTHTPNSLDALTLAAWRVLESYVPTQIRHLGVRNFSNLKRLSELHRNALVKPAVALRAFAPAGQWDLPMRAFCGREGIMYAASGVSNGVNEGLMRATPVALLAQFAGVEGAGAVTALLVAMGVPVVLDEESVEVGSVAKRREEVKRVQAWAAEKEDTWTTLFDDFVHLIRM
ncbi:NADP-dependent oxidoreductase domain-containing protein [Phyllosticta capitalensis]|uniref:NADP-dependent oxidoreductase domain-containing protein n=1 Tax=Phyllosticta capitalensis TaxID=121624 RepID=A0ABR1Z0I5_9PEZI